MAFPPRNGTLFRSYLGGRGMMRIQPYEEDEEEEEEEEEE